MKKYILTIALLFMANTAFADVIVTVDVTGWTGDQRTMIASAAHRILASNSDPAKLLVRRKIKGSPEIRLRYDALLPSSILLLVPVNLLAEIALIDSENAVNEAADQAARDTMRQQIRNHLRSTTHEQWTVPQVNYFLRAIRLMDAAP